MITLFNYLLKTIHYTVNNLNKVTFHAGRSVMRVVPSYKRGRQFKCQRFPDPLINMDGQKVPAISPDWTPNPLAILYLKLSTVFTGFLCHTMCFDKTGLSDFK